MQKIIKISAFALALYSSLVGAENKANESVDFNADVQFALHDARLTLKAQSLLNAMVGEAERIMQERKVKMHTLTISAYESAQESKNSLNQQVLEQRIENIKNYLMAQLQPEELHLATYRFNPKLPCDIRGEIAQLVCEKGERLVEIGVTFK